MFASFRVIRSKKKKRERREGGKNKNIKEKKFAGSSTDLEWSLQGKGERGMERDVAGEGSARGRGKRASEPGRERRRGASGWLRAMLSSPDLSPH